MATTAPGYGTRSRVRERRCAGRAGGRPG